MNNLCFTKMRPCNLWFLSQRGWISLNLKMMNKIKSFSSLIPLWPHLQFVLFLDWPLICICSRTNSFMCFVFFSFCSKQCRVIFCSTHGSTSHVRVPKKTQLTLSLKVKCATYGYFRQKQRHGALFRSPSLSWPFQWTPVTFANTVGASCTFFFFVVFFESASIHSYIQNVPPGGLGCPQ